MEQKIIISKREVFSFIIFGLQEIPYNRLARSATQDSPCVQI